MSNLRFAAAVLTDSPPLPPLSRAAPPFWQLQPARLSPRARQLSTTVPLLPPTTRKLHSPTSPPRSVPPQNRRPLSSLRPPPRQPPPRPTLRRSSTSQRRPTSPSSATCLPRA